MAVKELNGKVLTDYIKQRQAKLGRRLEAEGIKPKLAVVMTTDNPVIDSYVKMKRRYGREIGVDVEIQKVAQADLKSTIQTNNEDPDVHAMIIQLPLADESETDEAVALVASEKDVDGLGKNPDFDPATATAILWLLSGYNIDLKGKKIAVIGQGRLVGEPLTKMFESGGNDVLKVDEFTENPAEKVSQCQIVVSATGVAGLIKNSWIAKEAVIIDAGTAGEGGKVVGDVSDEVRERQDIKAITPLKGGVGPLTVSALFENTLQAASINAKD